MEKTIKPVGRNEQSRLGNVLNGVLGFVSGLILFLPSLWITYNLWDKFFFEILKNHYNTNTDDLLLIIFFYPAALVLSTILGIEGGIRGFRIKGKQWHAIVGSIIGGGTGGILTACLMTLVVVKGWVT